MAVLTGDKILEASAQGKILITPFDVSRLNPNSYNVRLHPKLLVYTNDTLDMAVSEPTAELSIPESGLVLRPGKLYLGQTIEYTETFGYIPVLEGRSSIGRLGLHIHVTAGWGDNGFKGNWTLELAVVQPLRIYPGVEIGQLAYHTVDYKANACETLYRGKYQDQREPVPSELWRDLFVKN